MIPPRYCYHVIEELRAGFNPVSILMYATCDYADAVAYMNTRLHVVTKKRNVYIKQGTSRAEADPLFVGDVEDYQQSLLTFLE